MAIEFKMQVTGKPGGINPGVRNVALVIAPSGEHPTSREEAEDLVQGLRERYGNDFTYKLLPSNAKHQRTFEFEEDHHDRYWVNKIQTFEPAFVLPINFKYDFNQIELNTIAKLLEMEPVPIFDWEKIAPGKPK